MDLNVEKGALLLLVAAVVAIVTRRLRLPYSIGLVAAGIVVALLPFSPRVSLTKELLFTLLLPPLIFEAAFFLPWTELRREMPVVLALATGGVGLSAVVTAAGMHYLAHWEWLGAWAFGVLVAATDPVSVIATFKEAKAQGRLLLLIESESLFNDGTAAVLFAIVLEFAAGHTMGPAEAAGRLAITVGGSLFCGAVAAGGGLLLTGRTDDHLVEVACTTVAAYGSFLVAEHFHFSGVLATLTAGLVMGNFFPNAISGRGREAVEDFWQYAAFVANSFVFLLIGMREASQSFASGWRLIGGAIVLVTLARAAAVYPFCALFHWSALRVGLWRQHVLVWGGLRGSLALALALGLPLAVPQRDAIVTLTFAVVAFSVFAQGLTLTPLLRRIGEIPGRYDAAAPKLARASSTDS